MLVGVWIMVLPFLYFPLKFEKALAVITGIGLVIGAYRTKDVESDSSSKKSSIPFVEHKSEPVAPITETQPSVEPAAAHSSLNTSSIDQPLTQ